MSGESEATEQVTERAFPKYDPRRARSRLFLSTMLGSAAALSLGQYSLAVRAVAGWNVFCIAQLSLAWWIIWSSDSSETRRRAAAEDPGRTLAGLLVLFSSVVTLFTSVVLLRRARVLAPEASGVLVLLCLTAVVGSWLVTHTTYTLRYARLYYNREIEPEGGLQFPGEHPPDDWDFAYFAFTIGMCFQVSDAVITSQSIRRTALVHALISFAYNTAIVALVLNLVFGLFS